MIRWKFTGLAATLVIVLLIPFYAWKEKQLFDQLPDGGAVVAAGYVGSEKCASCHKQEFDAWRGSHHDLAMDVATEKSVLGDFDNAEFEYFGTTSRFYRRDGRFYVHTQGPEGKTEEFEITIVRKFPRWYAALSFKVDNIEEDVGLSLSMWPEGAPQAALGNRRYTGLSPSTGIRPED